MNEDERTIEWSDDEKSLVVDMLQSKGWELFEAIGQRAIKNYRFLATQPPGVISEEMRTWYSALATGREEALAEVREKIQKDN